VVALYGFLRAQLSGEVAIFDGMLLAQNQILAAIESLRPSLVGVSVQMISYKNSLEIAAAAKKLGAVTVLGGHHASQIAERIIGNRPDTVDAVVVGDGELPLLAIARGVALHTVAGVVSRTGSGGKLSYIAPHHPDLAIYPHTDYSGVGLGEYDKLLRRDPSWSDVKRYLRMYSHKGCVRRALHGPCYFCGRADSGVRRRTPAAFWTEMTRAVDLYGADYVMDVGDDFLADSAWVAEVTRLRPTNGPSRPFRLAVFGAAENIDDVRAEALSSIGVADVTIGFESGGGQQLALTGKTDSSPKGNLEAAATLFRRGIGVTASYVLGLPGETESTLATTVSNARRLVELSLRQTGHKPREIVANLLEPSPGSPAFRVLEKTLPQRYLQNDELDLETLQRDYFRLVLGAESFGDYQLLRSQMLASAVEINAMLGFSDPQGWLTSEAAAWAPRRPERG
jgi:radical SAM superfamily enzyme YgiQ (UPF0313 family)